MEVDIGVSGPKIWQCGLKLHSWIPAELLGNAGLIQKATKRGWYVPFLRLHRGPQLWEAGMYLVGKVGNSKNACLLFCY